MTSPAAALASLPPVAGASAPGEASPAVPDHEVLRRIGRGSYGEIWLARALATGAWRAVKIVWRMNFDSERSFRREFEGMSVFEPISRSHGGFVDILQVGRNDARGFFYYVMELADDHATGLPLADPATYTPRTLRAVLQDQRRLRPSECLTLGASLAEALGALHAHGLSHRDVKPDNIIFVGGEPKLADIGLVAAHGQRSFVGTEGYVPPEGPGGVSADLYSLGKVLYEASMGRDRLDFPTFASDLESLGPEQASQLRGLNHVLLRACDPRPARRYESAQGMGADLQRLRDGGALHGNGRGRAWWVLLAMATAGVVAAMWCAHRVPAQPVARSSGSATVAAAPSAAATATPKRVAPPPQTGGVRLESEPPGAVVRLGERELGACPLTVADLPPGRAFFIFARPGFQRQRQEAVVTAGETGTVRVVLPPSRAPRPDAPWENGLGMRFLPLGGGVQMSQWKTRVRDFAAFADAAGYDATGGMSSLRGGADAALGATWREPGFAQTPDHPVVGVNWKDAYAFCDWLTQRAHESGELDDDQFYRLPTDLEWSRAVGLPAETGATPQARSNQLKGVYPWGTQFPPPPNAGNYAGTELRAPDADWPANLPTLPGGFNDGFARTSPVGSFAPNARGFYDLGGNAWEWCVDRFAPGGEARVLRGGSWGNVRADLLLSSKRIDAFPNTRSDLYGFRVVLETPAFGRVEITSEPAGATVFQDGRALGQTPLTLEHVPGGEAEYAVKLDDHQGQTVRGEVTAATALTLHATLASLQVPRAGQPWENALGMRFMPVGRSLLCSVWTTRVQDYEVFCHETGRAQPGVDFAQGPTHPVVNVSRGVLLVAHHAGSGGGPFAGRAGLPAALRPGMEPRGGPAR